MRKEIIERPEYRVTTHTFIIDRSGSMWSSLDRVIDDIISILKKLPPTDSVNIGWFSSKGDFDFPIVDAHILGIDHIIEQLNTIRFVKGTTCFSEVLLEANRIALKQSNVNTIKSLSFFTDGYPVPDSEDENNLTLELCYSVAENFDKSLWVGYRDYNRSQLESMAYAAGGSLVHANNLYTWFKAQKEFSGEQGFVPITLEEGEIAFYIRNGKIFQATKGVTEDYYVVDETKPFKYTEIEGAYAYAYVLMSNGRQLDAIDIMNKIGDKYLTERLTDSFTNDEYAQVATEIELAATEPSYRFKGGKGTLTATVGSYSVMDILERLRQENTRMLLDSDYFKYNTISKAGKLKPGYPEFKPFNNVVNMGDLVYNETRANVSIKTAQQGAVQLPENDWPEFQGNYQCTRFKNYAIIADGSKNVKNLLLINPKNTTGLIKIDQKYGTEPLYLLSLHHTPLITRKMIDEFPTPDEVIDLVKGINELKMALKVIKNYKDDVDLTTPLTLEQQEFLKENGVVNGSYSPRYDFEESKDYYLAKSVLIYEKGAKSLWSYNKAMEMVSKGKHKHYTRELEILDEDYNQASQSVLLHDERIFKEELNSLKAAYAKIIQTIVVGKQWWFDESETVYKNWVFKLDRVKVNI